MPRHTRFGLARASFAIALLLPAFLEASESWLLRLDGPVLDGHVSPVCSAGKWRAIEPNGTGGSFVLGIDHDSQVALLEFQGDGASRLADRLPAGYRAHAPGGYLELSRDEAGNLAAIGTFVSPDPPFEPATTWIAGWRPDGKRRFLILPELAGSEPTIGVRLSPAPGGGFFGVAIRTGTRAGISLVFRFSADGVVAWTREVVGTQPEALLTLPDGRLALAFSGPLGPRIAVVDGQGKLRFALEIDEEADRTESISAIAATSDGRIVVAGSSCLDESCDAMVALLGGVDGPISWKRRFRPDGVPSWGAMDVATDSANRIIVAGEYSFAPNDQRIAVAALSVEGTELWADSTIGNAGTRTFLTSVDRHPGGFVLVVGYGGAATANRDYFAARFEPRTGERIWLEYFDAGFGRTESTCDVAIDSKSGHALLTGRGQRTNADIWTIAVSPQGALAWSAFEPPMMPSDQVLGAGTVRTDHGRLTLAGDSSGGVVAVGHATVSTERNQALAVAIGADREVRWTYELPGTIFQVPDFRAVAIASDATTFLGGSASSAPYLVVAVEPGGEIRWSRSAWAGGTGKVANAVAATADGGVVATGVVSGAWFTDAGSISLDSAGNIRWSATFDYLNDAGIDVVALPDGGAAVLVDSAPIGSGVKSCHLLRYGPSGSESWRVRLTGPTGGNMQCTDVAPVPGGRFLVAGRAESRAIAVQVDGDGTVEWRAIVSDVADPAILRALDTAPNGDVVAVGEVRAGAQVGGWIGRFDSDGLLLWSRLRLDPDGGLASFRDVAVGADGRAHSAQFSRTSNPEPWLEVVTYSSDGDEERVVSTRGLIAAAISDAIGIVTTADSRVITAATAEFEDSGKDILILSLPEPSLFHDGFETGLVPEWSRPSP